MKIRRMHGLAPSNANRRTRLLRANPPLSRIQDAGDGGDSHCLLGYRAERITTIVSTEKSAILLRDEPGESTAWASDVSDSVGLAGPAKSRQSRLLGQRFMLSNSVACPQPLRGDPSNPGKGRGVRRLPSLAATAGSAAPVRRPCPAWIRSSSAFLRCLATSQTGTSRPRC